LVVALSAVVSGRSAWLLLGVTGMAYSTGASAVWSVVGYTVVEFFLFFFYARRLRRFADVHDVVTLPDFFAARFGDRDGWLRLALAGVILIFMVSYVSSQFAGGGKAIGASFGLSAGAGVILTAAIVLGYTMVGGFLAVSLTDTLQAFLMILGLVVLPLVAISSAGGWGAVGRELGLLDPTLIEPLSLGFGAFLGLVGIGLGSPGSPHILVRYLSIDDAEQLRWAAVVGTVWNVVMGAGAVLVGLAGRVYFPTVEMLPAADTENLYPVLAQQQLHPFLFGVIVASIFAAIMSTADSQLLVAASTVVRDWYEKVRRRGEALPDRTLVLYSRLVVVALVGAALLLGMAAENLVFWLVLFAWAGLGAALGPTSILALYWRGTTRAGVFAGLAVGTVTTIVWYSVPALKSRLYELIPAFGLSLIATWLVSLATARPDGVDEMFHLMEGEETRP
ncbi:MAG TPA: sodium/proline symporter, partial [Longimicrobiales bacterium]|nr:sodium/proline symporter [Longimicrobiales bacterium]